MAEESRIADGPCGGRHATLKKYLLAMTSVAAISILIQSACSGPGHGTLPIVPTQGTLALFGGDAPQCGVLSLTVTLTGLTLTPQSGASPGPNGPGRSEESRSEYCQCSARFLIGPIRSGLLGMTRKTELPHRLLGAEGYGFPPRAFLASYERA